MEYTKKHGVIAGQIGLEEQTCILPSQRSLKLLNLALRVRFLIVDDILIYEEIIRHMWLNSHLSNIGYDTLTDEQKSIFNGIIGEKPSDRSV